MKQSLGIINTVVTANWFNPSVFRETWLVGKKYLVEDEIQPGFVFSDQVVSVPSARFTLVVVPQQLQFAPSSRDTAAILMSTVLAPLVREVPHTPFTGVGINFVWHIELEDEPAPATTRRLFANPNCSLTQSFAEPDAKFGLYMSKNVPGSRLKLDVKPVDRKVAAPGTGEMVQSFAIQCSFNFHMEVSGEAAADGIATLCERWSEYDKMAEEMTTLLHQEVA